MARIRGSTYVVTTLTAGGPTTLGTLKGIPTGHLVYFVNVLNTDSTNTANVGSDLTSDYPIGPGGNKDFYFVDPANIQFAKTASAVKLAVDVSGEWPGACPTCDAPPPPRRFGR